MSIPWNGTMLLNSTIVNSTGSDFFGDADTFWPLHVRISLTILFAGLACIGIIGNLLVITVVLRVHGMVSIFVYNKVNFNFLAQFIGKANG